MDSFENLFLLRLGGKRGALTNKEKADKAWANVSSRKLVAEDVL